jgi:hypothetical protein
VDFYKHGLTFAQVNTEIESLFESGALPGCRNFAAFVYASSLRATGVTRKDAIQNLTAMAALCRPPLSGPACEGAVKSAWRQRSFKLGYHRMADSLKVSPAEAEIISHTIRRPFPEAGCIRVVTVTQEEKRAARQADRRLRIRLIAEDLGQPPSYRKMQALLFERGISTSHMTIMADYKALGMVSSEPVSRREHTPESRLPLLLS